MSNAIATESNTLLSTTIDRRWLTKMMIFAIVLLVIGAWGFYDAAIAYPKRGFAAAEILEGRYLSLLRDRTGHLDNKAATVEDPAAEHARTSKAVKDQTITPIDRALYVWLDQLRIVGKLQPEHTRIPRTDFYADGVSKGGAINDAQARLDLLDKAPHAKPLEPYDLPVQWLICAVGTLWFLYLVFLIVRVKARVYRWDAAAKRLHLPDGASITPADLAEFDKRKWHKFFVSIKIREGHAQLAGKTIELDLLRYVPLEAWVLEMERIAFPDEAQESAGHEPDQPQEAAAKS